MDNDFMELYKGYTDEQYNDLADMSYLEEFMESKKKPTLLEDRAFLFQSSYRKSYWTLKKHDPNLALWFLECLIDYGGTGKLPDLDDQPVVQALLYGPIKTIDKAFINYVERSRKIARERRKLEEEAAHKIQEEERRKEEAVYRVSEQEALVREATNGNDA